MATPNETFVLVRMDQGETVQPVIAEVIRTYLSMNRAQEDRDLLAETVNVNAYAILTVSHIDN